ncbi:helix-turn-helix transcriptional regulator [Phenylobacterium aquaticum]|uniref:helix-turn-helix transcriptional regulator n=1 Tax=Phenylobacterium aquaticum TaxID=1763816 RepID=UPI0026EBCBA6|nr:helix-turn-helix transcriptional regulator [Phenylobacterium aquaticum]
MPPPEERLADLTLADQLARAVAELGREIDLPFVAASADISSPDPMLGADGLPLAESVFRWVDPDLAYWRDRGFALRAPFVLAARYMAEPFYFHQGRFATWRPTPRLDSIAVDQSAKDHGVAGAIIAPAYLPGGVIGTVVWATPDPSVDVAALFDAQAARLHAAALKLMATYHEARGALPAAAAARLTRREIQCLKWAAAGKTDAVIAELIQIAAPTVRFHLKNAAQKLHVVGRSQAVREAAALGYVGGGLNPARRPAP